MSLAAGHPIAADKMATMADGIAVGCRGRSCSSWIRGPGTGSTRCREDALSRALLQPLEHKTRRRTSRICGGARLNETPNWLGRAGRLRALRRQYRSPLLLRIIWHGMAAAGAICSSVVMPDRPGSLARLISD